VSPPAPGQPSAARMAPSTRSRSERRW
jgi:hypothetical protein